MQGFTFRSLLYLMVNFLWWCEIWVKVYLFVICSTSIPAQFIPEFIIKNGISPLYCFDILLKMNDFQEC